MSVYVLDNRLWFPPVSEATEDGLLAIGGDLCEARLLMAYEKGIFPWYEDDEVPLWWCPNPRFVLFPEELHVSKSMKQVINSNKFEFRFNSDFEMVIHQCKNISRKKQDGTWIIDDIEAAYINLNKKNYAFSAEAWQNNKLVGGLYGVRLNNIFFGESMFALQPNASKFAFIKYIEQLKNEGIKLIDCQVYSPHLETLGARFIKRDLFLKLIDTK